MTDNIHKTKKIEFKIVLYSALYGLNHVKPSFKLQICILKIHIQKTICLDASFLLSPLRNVYLLANIFDNYAICKMSVFFAK